MIIRRPLFMVCLHHFLNSLIGWEWEMSGSPTSFLHKATKNGWESDMKATQNPSCLYLVFTHILQRENPNRFFHYELKTTVSENIHVCYDIILHGLFTVYIF